jgi:L-lysine exporter family protein LysE/ArgO
MLGFAYAAPIGAQNLFVIESASRLAPRRAFAVALFVALNDIALAAACFWGIGLLLNRYLVLKPLLLAVGTVLLVKLAWDAWRSAQKAELDYGSVLSHHSLIKIAATSALLTWCNPQALLDGIFLLGTFKASLSSVDQPVFFAGVSSASAAWFLGLTAAVSSAKKITRPVLPYIAYACAVFMLFFAFKMGSSVVNYLLEASEVGHHLTEISR